MSIIKRTCIKASIQPAWPSHLACPLGRGTPDGKQHWVFISMTLGTFLFRLEPVISSVSWNKQRSFPGSVCGKNLIEVVGMKAPPPPSGELLATVSDLGRREADFCRISFELGNLTQAREKGRALLTEGRS